jgi:hypothetical protein
MSVGPLVSEMSEGYFTPSFTPIQDCSSGLHAGRARHTETLLDGAERNFLRALHLCSLPLVSMV